MICSRNASWYPRHCGKGENFVPGQSQIPQTACRYQSSTSHRPAFLSRRYRPATNHPCQFLRVLRTRSRTAFNPAPNRTQEFTQSAVHSKVPDSVSGANVFVVGHGVTIGEGVILYPGVVIGDGVSIGAGSVLYPNVVIYRDCVIGASCHSGRGGDWFWMASASLRRWSLAENPQIGVSSSVMMWKSAPTPQLTGGIGRYDYWQWRQAGQSKSRSATTARLENIRRWLVVSAAQKLCLKIVGGAGMIIIGHH